MFEGPRIAVLGGGVNGIGTALAILKKIPNCQLSVISEAFTPDTTGDGAAGLWEPYSLGHTPLEKVVKWSMETWNLFEEWKDQGRNYVLQVPITEISRDELNDPEWLEICKNFRHLSQPELKRYGTNYQKGFTFDTLIAQPSILLPNLMNEISNNGGQFIKKKIYSLSDVGKNADIIVNCTGIGSYDLVQDHGMYPARGQVIRVNAPWVNYVLIDATKDERAYIIKNPFSIVLGGILQENDWRTTIDSSDTKNILERTAKLDPTLKGAEILAEWAGLRPVRKNGVRIEKDFVFSDRRKVPVVHNYGHGGSGVTIFWGCSQEAADLTAKIVHEKHVHVSKL